MAFSKMLQKIKKGLGITVKTSIHNNQIPLTNGITVKVSIRNNNEGN